MNGSLLSDLTPKLHHLFNPHISQAQSKQISSAFFFCYIVVIKIFTRTSHLSAQHTAAAHWRPSLIENSGMGAGRGKQWKWLMLIGWWWAMVMMMGEQGMCAEEERVVDLRGQPPVNFSHFAGYVNVNASHGRALFYWFFEATSSPASKPLVLWLNGGPGCSSVGYGALEEIGPFIVNKDGSSLSLNEFSWNKEANLLFLESPAGVGFSYSNTTSDYSRFGDFQTSLDSYAFLIGWFEKFPQYKSHDFYITGESYAGHYVPQLAKLITDMNGDGHHQIIKLKGIMIGNALIDDALDNKGIVDFAWSHGVISNSFYKNITKTCDFKTAHWSQDCSTLFSSLFGKYKDLNIYDVIVDICLNDITSSKYHVQHKELPSKRTNVFNVEVSTKATYVSAGANDPCIDNYVYTYLNRQDVQRSLHANVTNLSYQWSLCSDVLTDWTDSPTTILPILEELMLKGLRVWIFSGDLDGRIPFISTQYSLSSLQLPIINDWHPWYYNGQVAGWSEIYRNLTHATVRGAGHMVPTYQPERALALFSNFIRGKKLPTRNH